MKCPCKGCERRTITCHGFCKEYKEWSAWNSEVNEKKKQDNNILMDLPRASKQAWYKKLKYGR